MSDTVTIDALCPFQLPNVITPNGDEFNQCFVIKGAGINEWNVRIYNRWGREVFSALNYQDEWCGDGLADGMYLYHISTQREGQLTEYKGWVQIMR